MSAKLNLTFFDEHKEEVLPIHARILTTAIELHFALFGQLQAVEGSPLWIRLILSNCGLRLFSSQWISAIDHIFLKFGLKITRSLLEGISIDAGLAYRLGQFEIAKRESQKFLGELSTSTRLLSLKIRAREDPDLSVLSDIGHLDFTDIKNASAASAIIISLFKAKKISENYAADYLTGILSDVKKSSIANDPELLSYVHIINSLNYLTFKRCPDDVQLRLSYLEDKIVPEISDQLSRNHVLGIIFFHRSYIKRLDCRFATELDLLEKASSFDFGFSEYYYRIAQLHHDAGNHNAKKYYQAALKTSPLHLSIVNLESREFF